MRTCIYMKDFYHINKELTFLIYAGWVFMYYGYIQRFYVFLRNVFRGSSTEIRMCSEESCGIFSGEK